MRIVGGKDSAVPGAIRRSANVDISLRRNLLSLGSCGQQSLQFLRACLQKGASVTIARRCEAFFIIFPEQNDEPGVAAHNSVWPENIGVLRRPFYRGRHVYNPVRDSFSGLLPVSASGLLGT